MSVTIVSENQLNESTGSDYLRVSTCNDPLDDTVTLATIERVVARKRRVASASPMRIKTLVQQQPMSPDAAVGLATCYAERKNIPVICLSRPQSAAD